MSRTQPETTLGNDFSSPQATSVDWSVGQATLSEAEIYWLATVRPDGRPHVTPLIAIWMDDTLYFCTGPDERKARNLADNPHCVITTGCNRIDEGLDVVVEGAVRELSDSGELNQLAGRYKSKYGWTFSVRGDGLYNEEGGKTVVYSVTPATAFGFGRGEKYSQTRWRFDR